MADGCRAADGGREDISTASYRVLIPRKSLSPPNIRFTALRSRCRAGEKAALGTAVRFRRRIHPTTSGFEDMHDPGDDAAIINPRYAATPVGQERDQTRE